jgi:hypothetical protein
MKRRLVGASSMVLLAACFALPVRADRTLARFDGGIGATPLRSGGTPNVVQGVNPGGVPWVISSLKANVQVDGHILVEGRGLLFAGGNNVGRSGNVAVRARLFCDAAAHDSGAVFLDDDGDFVIDGDLTPLPPLNCVNPTLLIVNAGGTAWFAAGIPRS